MQNTEPFPLSLDQARTLFDILTYNDIVYSSIDIIASIANHYNELHDEYRDIDWCWIYGVEERPTPRSKYSTIPQADWVSLSDACARIKL